MEAIDFVGNTIAQPQHDILAAMTVSIILHAYIAVLVIGWYVCWRARSERIEIPTMHVIDSDPVCAAQYAGDTDIEHHIRNRSVEVEPPVDLRWDPFYAEQSLEVAPRGHGAVYQALRNA